MEVSVDEMNHHQLTTRAIRIILDKAGRRNLAAIPASFNQISDITTLNLSNLDLRILPECINLLTGLRNLSVGHNKFTDESLPDTLWQLTELEHLYMNDNQLKSLPKSIGKLSSLTILIIGGNNLVSLPDEFYNLKNLKQLHSYNNKLIKISELIGNLENLTDLSLSWNQLITLPKSIGKLTKLKNDYGLYIYDNPFTSLPDSIRKVNHAMHIESKIQYAKLITDAEKRIELRFERRLTILTAQIPIKQIKNNSKQINKRQKVIWDVLVEPKIALLIAKYIDWK